MKKPYSRPVVVEYGRIDQLTLGGGGSDPDFTFDPGGNLKLVNTSCAAGGSATACLVPAGSPP
jgi:hypothetical protein